MVFLSVIVPTYNSEKSIERCLQSLVIQSFQDFEICFIDGASLDSTLSKICDFRSDFKNIRIISEKDQGTYDAMNKGIDIARGDWLFFLGSDDEVADNKVFEDIFMSSESKNSELVYGNTFVSEDTSWAKANQLYDGAFDIVKLLSKNICHQSIFYKKDLFNRYGKYKVQYSVCADWEMNLRLYPKTEFIYIDRTISIFYGGGLSSEAFDDVMARNLEGLRQQALREYKLRKILSRLNLA